MERDTHKPPLSSPFVPRPKCLRFGQGICGGEGGGEAALAARGVEESQVWGSARVNGRGLCVTRGQERAALHGPLPPLMAPRLGSRSSLRMNEKASLGVSLIREGPLPPTPAQSLRAQGQFLLATEKVLCWARGLQA